MKFRCIKPVIGKLTEGKIYEGEIIMAMLPVSIPQSPLLNPTAAPPQPQMETLPVVVLYDDSKTWMMVKLAIFAAVANDNLIDAIEFAARELNKSGNQVAVGTIQSMIAGQRG